MQGLKKRRIWDTEGEETMTVQENNRNSQIWNTRKAERESSPAFLRAVQVLGLREEESLLLLELWKRTEEGEEGLPLESVRGFESLSPCFVADKKSLFLSGAVFSWLQELPPRLPLGMESCFPAVQKVYGCEKYLAQAEKLFTLGEPKEEGGDSLPLALVISGEEGSGRHYLMEQVCARQQLPVIYLREREEDYEDRELQELLLAAGLYGAFVCAEAGTKNQEALFQKLAAAFSMIGVICGRERKLLEDTGFGAVTWRLEKPDRRTKLRILADMDFPEETDREQLASRQLPMGIFLRYLRNLKLELLAGNSVSREQLWEPESMYLNLLPATRTFEELKLPKAQHEKLREICRIVRAREQVLEDWGFQKKFSYGNGISVLFYGAPGTGKTMAAQVMANALGLPLYRVELSQVVSKYIGETQKNIGRIFDEAQKCDCILLFDEADAMFARRSEVSDAQDRYSNGETAYLLQRMEQYPGVSILATNLFQNFDEAFRRRITYMVHFPMPDEKLRSGMWESIFPEEAELSEDFDALALAQAFELSGAAIKNAAFHGACQARAEGGSIRMRHILDGIRNEYEKQGKSMSTAQKELIHAYRTREDEDE